MAPFTNQILRTLRQKERSTIHLHRPERVHAHGKPISRANLRIYQRLPYYLIRFIPHYILPVIPFHIVIPLIYRADLWCSVRLAVVRKWVFGGAKELFRGPPPVGRADWKVTCRGPRPAAERKVQLFSIISTIHRIYWEELQFQKISRISKCFEK